MKLPMRFKYYDNWAKVPMIISGLLAGSGLLSWFFNYVYLEDGRMYYQDKLNEYLLIGIPALCCFAIFKYYNYRIELKENTGLWSIEGNDEAIKTRLDVIWDIIGDPDVKKKISSEIYSTENRLVRLAILGQLESSINEEIRKIEVLNAAHGLVDKLTEATQSSFLSDLRECKYAYQMEKVIENYTKEKEI